MFVLFLLIQFYILSNKQETLSTLYFSYNCRSMALCFLLMLVSQDTSWHGSSVLLLLFHILFTSAAPPSSMSSRSMPGIQFYHSVQIPSCIKFMTVQMLISILPSEGSKLRQSSPKCSHSSLTYSCLWLPLGVPIFPFDKRFIYLNSFLSMSMAPTIGGWNLLFAFEVENPLFIFTNLARRAVKLSCLSVQQIELQLLAVVVCCYSDLRLSL